MEKAIRFIQGLDPLALGLGGLGILIILSVLIINWFQARRLRSETAQSPTAAPVAPAFIPREGSDRMEPTLSGRSAPAAYHGIGAQAIADDVEVEIPPPILARPAPVVAPTVTKPEIPAAPTRMPLDEVDISLDPALADSVSLTPVGPREPTAPIDGRVHSIVKMRLPNSMSPQDAREMVERVVVRFPRGAAWVWSASAGAWTSVRHGHVGILPAADAIAFSMPLATRNGAVTESTLRDWMEEIETGGRDHAAEMVYAPLHDDAKRAVELDAFCGNLDLLVGVNLMRADHSAIPGTRLRGTLEAEGFHLNEHGAFEMGSEDGQHMLYEIRNAHGQPMTADSLRNDGVHGLSLTLDVMRVPNPVQHFDMMRTLAKRLATRLEAVMVDDRGHALTDALMQKIRGELEKRVTAARTAGIEPGSPLARTLFGE
jgi:ZipA, C-terminal FtsZ-binding domain